MPLAASKEPLVPFVVIGEGVPVTAYEEALHGRLSGDGIWNAVSVARADAALQNIELPSEVGFDPSPMLSSLEIPIL